MYILRSRRLGAAALGISGFGAAAITFAAFPTVAQGAVAAVTSVSCSVTGSNWCISGNNSSSGIGVIGTSKSGTGLRGTSTSQYGLKATSGSNVAIFAQTTSGSSAITALAGSNGNGVNASAGGVGLSGTSTAGGEGVLGYSKSGIGVYGLSSTEAGGHFDGGSGDGVEAYGQNVALYAKSSQGQGANVEGGAYGVVASASGSPLVLEDSNFNVVFQVDSHGNVKYKGSLSTLAKTVRGGTTSSFNSNSTQPTLEDMGTAQLVRGMAVVRLDPAFAASIEPAVGYRVVVTPNGDTRGLYVAGKTAAGFVVRESQAGRSTVTFDYRIVGTALGAAGQHMAIRNPAATHPIEAHIPGPLEAAGRARPAPTVESVTP